MTSLQYMHIRRYSIVILKYFLATLTSLYLANLITPGGLLSCAFIAVLTLQPNLYRGLKYSWTQLEATVLATAVTTGVVWLLQFDFAARPTILSTALAMGITIFFCLRLNLEQGTVIALFTVVYLSVIPMMKGSSFAGAVHLRYLTILIGVGTAAVFNFLSSLFRYRDRLFLHLVSSGQQLVDHFENIYNELKISEETPTDEKYDSLLNNFGEVFASLRALRSDLDEIETESQFLGHTAGQQENLIHRSLLNTINDISHYGWDLLLNLKKHELAPDTAAEITGQFHQVTTDLSSLLECLEKIECDKSELQSKINRRVDRLNRKMNQMDLANSRAAGPMVGIYSDLAHLNLNLLQFQNQLTEFIALRSDD